ncbi:hypothetical protein NBRC116592_32670 [Colwellia sp. KU-HH00111]
MPLALDATARWALYKVLKFKLSVFYALSSYDYYISNPPKHDSNVKYLKNHKNK